MTCDYSLRNNGAGIICFTSLIDKFDTIACKINYAMYK